MSTIEEKIAHLLRRAVDQDGTPEGATCRVLADELMRRHNVHVILDEQSTPAFDRRVTEILERESPWHDVVAQWACTSVGVFKMWRIEPERAILWLGGEPALLSRAQRLYQAMRDVVAAVDVPRSVTVPSPMGYMPWNPWHNTTGTGWPPYGRSMALILVEADFRLGLAQGLVQKLEQVRLSRARRSPMPQEGLEIHERKKDDSKEEDVFDDERDPWLEEHEAELPPVTALARRTHTASRYAQEPPPPTPTVEPRTIQIDRESFQRGAMAATMIPLQHLLETLCEDPPP